MRTTTRRRERSMCAECGGPSPWSYRCKKCGKSHNQKARQERMRGPKVDVVTEWTR